MRQPKRQGKTVAQSTKKRRLYSQKLLKLTEYVFKGKALPLHVTNRLLTQFGSHMETSRVQSLKFQFNKHHYKLITMQENMTDQVRP